MQKVCYCDNGSGYTFWFEITNKNDSPIDYYYEVYKNAGNVFLLTGTGTIQAGVGPSQTRLDYFKIEIPYSGVPGTVILHRACDDDHQATIGFHPPNFNLCDNGCVPSMLLPDITLIADPSACLYAQPSALDVPSVLSAYVYDYTGGPIADGTDVTFTITSGPGEFRPGPLSEITVQTSGGVATVDLYQDGTYAIETIYVTATVSMDSYGLTLTSSDSASVGMCPVCSYIDIHVDYNTLDENTPSTRVIAIPRDYAGNYMPEGFHIDIQTTIGTISNLTPTAYNVPGYETDLAATAILTYDPFHVPGIAVVSTSSICGAEASIHVAFLPTPLDGSILLSAIANPTTVCGGNGTSMLYASYLDGDGAHVVGADITFEIVSESNDNSSSSLGTNPVATGEDGVASTSLSDSEYESVTVKASYTDGFTTLESDPLIVIFQSSGPVDMILSPDSITLDTCNGVPVPITVTLLDCSGAPVEGADVDFSTTVGSLGTVNGLTDSNGQLITMLYPSGDVEQGTFTASYSDATTLEGTVHLTFVAGEPCAIVLDADPLLIPANNTSISLATATVLDCCGNFVNGVDVCFETTDGVLLTQPPQDTTIGGQAHMPLQSTFDPAIATVTVYVCSDPTITDSVNVIFESLPQASPPNDNIWTIITIQPIYNTLLKGVNLGYGCLLESLPEELPEGVLVALDDIQEHMSNVASGGSNFVYFSGELQRALDGICHISQQLSLDCCHN